MDPKDELAEERARRIKAEHDLAAWQNGEIQKLSPEQIAAVIQTQQLQALTYSLMKQKQVADEATAKLRAKEKELTEAVCNIKRLEADVDDKTRELEKLKVKHEPKRAAEGEVVGQRFGVSGIPTDEELENILSGSLEAPAPKPRVLERAKRNPKSFKDFIQLIRRMERLNLYDAALLLDQNQDDVLLWAQALERKGYITIHGMRQKTLEATDKILKTR